jgi:ABC-2 type transport system permease protein
MTRHFAYLVLRSGRNSVMRQLRRLRNPRYAIALLFGLAYFFFIFGGLQDDEMRREISGVTLTGARMLGPVFIGLVAAWWWLWGGHRHGVLLSPAETHLLLPAPVTRRQLIRYKIMSAQVGILFSALMGSLLTRGAGMPFPLRFLSLWVMIATLYMHQVAASLVHASAQEQGREGVRRQWIPLVLFSAAFVTLLASLARAVAQVRTAGSVDDAMGRLVAVLGEPGPSIALAPFRLLLAPTVAASAAEWAPAFAGAVVVLLLHYVWVQRTDAAFEEVAAEEGARQAIRENAVRTGGLARLRFTSVDRPKTLAKPWLPLSPTGRAAYAVTWKNVVLAQRSVRIMGIILPLIALVTMVFVINDAPTTAERARVAGFMLLVFAGLATLAGPIAVRLDLRVDLRYIDLLRTYPVPGRDLVAAGMLATTSVIVLGQILLAGVGLVLLTFSGWLSPLVAAGAMAGVLVAGPIVVALGVAIQNAIVLLYPGWSRIGDVRSGGVESVGQGVLTLIGALVLLVLALVPPVIAAALVGGILSLALGAWAVVPGAVAALLVVAGETVLGVLWLGRLYDTTDPVEAGLLMR